MGAHISLVQHLHLTMVEGVLLTGSLAVGQGLVHLVAGIDHGLHVFPLQVFFGELRYLMAGLALAAGKDGLGE